MSLAPYIPMTTSPETVTVKFRFQINGTSDPDSVRPGFQGITDVIRNATPGEFIVTLATKYPVLIGLVGSVMGATGASLGLVVQAGVADYVPATGKLTVRTIDTYSDATPAAADPADDDWVYVEATFGTKNDMHRASAI